MKTTIFLAHEVSAAAAEAVKRHCVAVAAFDPRWNGVEFQIERDDVTHIAGSDSDSYKAVELLQDVRGLISES